MELNFNRIKVNITGESHSPKLDIEISGLKQGESFSISKLQDFMSRRQGDGSYLAELCSTTRKEADIPVFDSGIKIEGDVATIDADIIEAHIDNKDAKPADYDDIKTVLRPGHSDLGAYIKYGIDGLKSGGGEFSGRMTAAYCLAGGIALQILEKQNIEISTYILQVAGMNVGFLDEEEETEFISRIEQIKADGDSCGGVVGCTIKGMTPGIGGAGTQGLEGDFARAMLAIPAAKGIEFGSGFEGAYYTGSVNNDEYHIVDGKVQSRTNKHGGISGGISTGMNITMNVAFKPVPSIKLPQNTVDVKTMQETTIEIDGRHDVCIVPRVLPVVEALAGLVVLDRLEA